MRIWIQFILFILFIRQVKPQTTMQLLEPGTTNPGSPVFLSEQTTSLTKLAVVSCTPDTTTGCFCTKNSLVPSGPFDVYILSGDTDYTVYYTVQAALDEATTAAYEMTVLCRDEPDSGAVTATSTLVINVLPNFPPTITGGPTVTASTLNADAGTTVSGTTIYTVTATDPEGELLSYSMTQSPENNYFELNDNLIKTAVDLRTITTDNVVLTVTVSDGEKTNQVKVTVPLSNLNTRPVISNMPTSVNLSESLVSGTTLLTLTFSDDTPHDSLVPSCSVDPAAESYKFTYDTGTKRLLLNDVSSGETLLDYETTDQYIITCVVYDGFLYSQGDKLTFHVENVNEAPEFSQTTYICSIYESDADANFCALGVTVSDPELNNINRVEIQSGGNSDRFTYDRNEDRLSFAIMYDVDGGAYPTSDSLELIAVDSIGATGTSTISINVLDDNDNTCNFGGLTGAAAQFTVNQGTSLGTLGTLAGNDDDLTSPNNVVTFEMIGGLTSDATRYLTVFSNGEIFYSGLIPETEHGNSFGVTVRCKDGGSPSMSSTATVQISYLTTTTSTTTTTTTTTTASTTTASSSSNIFDEVGFVVVFVILMILLLLLLLLAVWYFCCRQGSPIMCDFGPQYQKPPPMKHVQPINRNDFFHGGSGSRVAPDYKDHHWKSGDHYEDGFGFEGSGRPVSNSDIFLTNSRQRALPAPQGYY